MRKALSLIELIFTIVIIAIVFTVIPKVILSLNKSDSFSIRQDAIFNGVSLVNMISKLPYDEANTKYPDILHTDSLSFTCSTLTQRRIGGFIGSRNCEQNLSTSLGKDGEIDYTSYNDIDDFFQEDNISASPYKLKTQVKYISDSYSYSGTKVVIDLNNSVVPLGSTNLKRLDIKVNYVGKRGEEKQLTQFNYISSNIGQTRLNKREW